MTGSLAPTVAAIGLAVRGKSASKKIAQTQNQNWFESAAIVIDTAVDDKSFNQSAWKVCKLGRKKTVFLKETGFDYFQSTDEFQYATNLDEAALNDYKLIFGVGFALRDAEKAVSDNEGTNFVIIDAP